MSACAGCGAALPPSKSNRPRKWCSDRCRRHTTYSRPCADCGKPTYNGTNPPPERCNPCSNHLRKLWTREAIIGAIQAWVESHGAPPAAHRDWLTAGPWWPASSTVVLAFGAWNAALEAAGVETRHTTKLNLPLYREIADRYEAGETAISLAAEYGCTDQAIRWRIHRVGGNVRSLGDARQLALARAKAAA